MRDANRLKERVDLHLDRRQVTSIALVSLLLLGTVFALGVMVGKNLAPQAKAGPAPSLLDRLDARVSDGGASDGLTFQEELTRRSPPERPVVRAPAPRAEHAPAPVINVPTVSDEAPAVPTAVAPPAAAAAKTGGGEAEDEVAIEEAKKDRSPRPQASPTPKPAVPSAAAPAFFTVQVKATQSSGEAEKFAAKLRLQGYHTLVAEADVPGKGRWYRVRVGHFDSRAQAEHYLGDFERETHLSAFVTAGGH
jgi:DedD protein